MLMHKAKKSTSSFALSLRYCKLVILVTLGMTSYAHPKLYCQLVEKFRVYLQAKIPLHTPHFSGDIAKICKLLVWALWVYLAPHTQNDSINL